jgi:hypothetical protein
MISANANPQFTNTSRAPQDADISPKMRRTTSAENTIPPVEQLNSKYVAHCAKTGSNGINWLLPNFIEIL